MGSEVEFHNYAKETEHNLTMELDALIKLLVRWIEAGEPTRNEEESLRKALSLMLGINNCYCDECQELSAKYYVIPK